MKAKYMKRTELMQVGRKIFDCSSNCSLQGKLGVGSACSLRLNSLIDPFAKKETGHQAICLFAFTEREAHMQMTNSVGMAEEGSGSDW